MLLRRLGLGSMLVCACTGGQLTVSPVHLPPFLPIEPIASGEPWSRNQLLKRLGMRNRSPHRRSAPPHLGHGGVSLGRLPPRRGIRHTAPARISQHWTLCAMQGAHPSSGGDPSSTDPRSTPGRFHRNHEAGDGTSRRYTVRPTIRSLARANGRERGQFVGSCLEMNGVSEAAAPSPADALPHAARCSVLGGFKV